MFSVESGRFRQLKNRWTSTPLLQFRNSNVDLIELVLNGGNRRGGSQFHLQVLGQDIDDVLPTFRQFLKLVSQRGEGICRDLVSLQDVDVAVRIDELIGRLARLP